MYQFDCLCGEPVKTPTKTGRCPNCRRFFDLRWPNDAQLNAPAAVGKESLPPEKAKAAGAGG